MKLRQLDHYNLNTAKPDETIAFYCEVLGCVNRPERRPAFGQPGAWLFVEDHAAIHLNFVSDERGTGNGRTGALDHVAFEASGYLAFGASLKAKGIDHQTAEMPEADLMQIFLFDPNGVKLELNFRGEAAAVAAARA